MLHSVALNYSTLPGVKVILPLGRAQVPLLLVDTLLLSGVGLCASVPVLIHPLL